MSVFVDTNILLRAVQPNHPLHSIAVRAVSALLAQNEVLVLTPQIMAEFWNVATRPQLNNGLGLSTKDALSELVRLESFFTVLDESAAVYQAWKVLVEKQGVTGVQVHDARLVAAMHVYNVLRILTFNTGDFTRYKQIEIVYPQALSTFWQP
jgi:predicted nucleic acid-binding protein